MDISNLLTNVLSEKAINSIATKTGLDPKIAKAIASKAMPMILAQLKTNSSDSQSADSLEKAVEGNDGSILYNPESIDLDNGSKINSHIFGDKLSDIENKVGDKNVLSALSPLVMGALGKANSDSGQSASSLLSSNGLITSFLDKDGDGDVKDDILTMIMNIFKGKSKK